VTELPGDSLAELSGQPADDLDTAPSS